MKLNFSKPFLNLAGDEIAESNQGKALSDALAGSTDPKEGDVFKYWEWAQKCHKGETIDLDKADQKKLRDFIEKTGFNVLMKSQLLETLDDGGEPKKGGGGQ